jgi:hypothetical protein
MNEVSLINANIRYFTSHEKIIIDFLKRAKNILLKDKKVVDINIKNIKLKFYLDLKNNQINVICDDAFIIESDTNIKNLAVSISLKGKFIFLHKSYCDYKKDSFPNDFIYYQKYDFCSSLWLNYGIDIKNIVSFNNKELSNKIVEKSKSLLLLNEQLIHAIIFNILNHNNVYHFVFLDYSIKVDKEIRIEDNNYIIKAIFVIDKNKKLSTSKIKYFEVEIFNLQKYKKEIEKFN